MPKSKTAERKVYKCVRKTIDGDRNFLALKFKNLSSTDIREVKAEINALMVNFWEESDTEREVTFDTETKE